MRKIDQNCIFGGGEVGLERRRRWLLTQRAVPILPCFPRKALHCTVNRNFISDWNTTANTLQRWSETYYDHSSLRSYGAEIKCYPFSSLRQKSAEWAPLIHTAGWPLPCGDQWQAEENPDLRALIRGTMEPGRSLLLIDGSRSSSTVRWNTAALKSFHIIKDGETMGQFETKMLISKWNLYALTTKNSPNHARWRHKCLKASIWLS